MTVLMVSNAQQCNLLENKKIENKKTNRHSLKRVSEFLYLYLKFIFVVIFCIIIFLSARPPLLPFPWLIACLMLYFAVVC